MDREQQLVHSYEGAVLLLAAVLEQAPELVEAVRERAEGRSRQDAVMICAELLHHYHRACTAERLGEIARRRKAEEKGLKLCSRCGRSLPVAEFNTDRGRPRPECRSCHHARDREIYRARH